jgi:translation elongation factor EF-Tu-like GTPase
MRQRHVRVPCHAGRKGNVGIEPGVRFAIRDGGKTVGAGLVTEVTD